jgi:amino acid permease
MKSQVYRALYAFLTSICLLFAGILFVLITKDDWQLNDTQAVICTALLFLMFPIYGKLCHHFGKMAERNRQRTRVTNLMIVHHITHKKRGEKQCLRKCLKST